MRDCVHCGLPPSADCADHPMTVRRKVKTVAKVERNPKDEQSIHPRVVNGRTAHPKVNTSKKPRAK